VVLIEAGPRVLAGFPDDLSAYAQASLERSASRWCWAKPVTECTADGVVYGGNRLEAKTIIWAAGVRASRAAEWLGAPADRAYRVQVEPDLTVPGHPDIFAVGDTVTIAGPDGNPVPGHRAGRQATGALCRETDQGAAERRHAAAVPLQACRQPRADRQAQGGDRFRLDQAARHPRLVDLGHRPHLLPDRPAQPAQRRDELAVDPCPRSEPEPIALDWAAPRSSSSTCSATSWSPAASARRWATTSRSSRAR
jgi:hypothetical protein